MISEILIDNMEFFAFHGFYPEEQRVGCKYTVSLKLITDLSSAGNTDDLNTTINYEEVYQLVKKEMNINSKLIEHVASRIIKALKKKYSILKHVDLYLYKYNPPLGGQVERVGIHLYD